MIELVEGVRAASQSNLLARQAGLGSAAFGLGGEQKRRDWPWPPT